MFDLQIVALSFALAMDSFSVSVAAGLRAGTPKFLHGLKLAFIFGFFQAMMPLVGWLAGQTIKDFVLFYGHFIAFALLSVIGVKMILGSIKEIEKGKELNLLGPLTLLGLALATSLDALIAGVSLSLIKIPLLISVVTIGLTTFVLCILGYNFGKHLSLFIKERAEILGGVALILIGIKILLENIY